MSAADLLETALTIADVRQAMQAAQELAGRPDQVAALLPRLARAMADSQAPIARRAAQVHGALGRLAQQNLPVLLAALASPRWTIREAVVGALGRVAPDDEAVRSALIDRVLFDRKPAVRELAMAVLHEQAGVVLGLLQPALQHRHPRVRCRTLRAMTRLAPADEQVAILRRALDDSHFRVRRDAARLIGSLGMVALPILPRLVRCRFDGESRVASAAAGSLSQIASSSSPDLAGWLQLLAAAGPSPEQALREMVTARELPHSIREAFVVACTRRRGWLVKGDVSNEIVESTPAAQLAATLAAAGERAGREAACLIGWLMGELIRDSLGNHTVSDDGRWRSTGRP